MSGNGVNSEVSNGVSNGVSSEVNNSVVNTETYEKLVCNTSLNQEDIINVIETEFKCKICRELLFKPVVGLCQHAFCRKCVKNEKTCPECRSAFILPRDCNKTITNIIVKIWPNEYLRREAQEKQDKINLAENVLLREQLREEIFNGVLDNVGRQLGRDNVVIDDDNSEPENNLVVNDRTNQVGRTFIIPQRYNDQNVHHNNCHVAKNQLYFYNTRFIYTAAGSFIMSNRIVGWIHLILTDNSQSYRNFISSQSIALLNKYMNHAMTGVGLYMFITCFSMFKYDKQILKVINQMFVNECGCTQW